MKIVLLSHILAYTVAWHHGEFLRGVGGHQSDIMNMASIAPYYHTTDKMHSELVGLSQRCNGMMVLETRSPTESLNLDVITIKDPAVVSASKNFFLFGEHARELISAEAALHLVKSLCGETDLTVMAKEALRYGEFQLVANANPRSRKKVEEGEYCLRVNENGVDLNRNWDEKWVKPDSSLVADFSGGDTYPGNQPFSEPETQILRELFTAYAPTNFLTVHSGTRGMYMPWAYDMQHLAQRNQPKMMHILQQLDKKYCECPFGAAGKEVGYSCPGTSLDWVYDKLNVSYAFAFEIYASEEQDADIKLRWQEKMRQMSSNFYQMQSHLAHDHFRDFFVSHPSGFVQIRENEDAESELQNMAALECFSRFNPDTKEKYQEVVHNWVLAFLELSTLVHEASMVA